MNPRCDICGRFLSPYQYGSTMTWTEYGSSWDTEPPEPKFAHGKCYQDLGPETHELMKQYTWLKPGPLGGTP